MTEATQTIDPVTFEILSHRLHQIAKEMGTTLERAGGTVNTTQQHDYMASLYRPNGDILATGESMPWHVACGGFTVRRILERFEHIWQQLFDHLWAVRSVHVGALDKGHHVREGSR